MFPQVSVCLSTEGTPSSCPCCVWSGPVWALSECWYLLVLFKSCLVKSCLGEEYRYSRSRLEEGGSTPRQDQGVPPSDRTINRTGRYSPPDRTGSTSPADRLHFFVAIAFTNCTLNQIVTHTIVRLFKENYVKFPISPDIFVLKLFSKTITDHYTCNTFQCMEWTWYLAVDMQFFIISPIFIYALYRYSSSTDYL